MELGLVDYKNNLLNLVNEYSEISKSYLSKQDFEDKASYINEYVIDRVNSLEPKIMVYGIYNAGKSTLLNALQGKSIAKMGDKPETYKITSYDWNGYTLMDTPGIDAPIEHEEISKENLKKSDVVLYVLSTNGTFDDKRNYEEMCNIIENSKKLIVILNNKNGYDVSHSEVIKIKEKVVTNIAKFSNDRNVGSKYSILLVNAKSALKAKLENKKNLLQRSNIKDIEIELMRSFKEINAFELLKTPINNMLEEINLLKLDVGKKIEDSDITKINDIQEVYQDMIQGMKSDIMIEIKNMLNNHQGQLASKIEKGESTDDIASKIQNSYSKLVNNINTEFKNIQIDDKELMKKINSSIGNFKIDDSGNISIKDTDIHNMNNLNKNNIDLQTDLSEVAISIDESIIGEGLSTLSMAKNNMSMKGMTSSKKILPVPQLDIIVPILGTLLNFLNKREERKYLEAQERVARLNLKAQEEANRIALIKQESNSLSKTFLYEIELDINSSLNKVIFVLKDIVDSIISDYYNMKSNDRNKHLQALTSLRNIENSIENIKNEI